MSIFYNDECVVHSALICEGKMEWIADTTDFITRFGYAIPLSNYGGSVMTIFNSVTDINSPCGTSYPKATMIPAGLYYTSILLDANGLKLVTIDGSVDDVKTLLTVSFLPYAESGKWRYFSGRTTDDTAITKLIQDCKTHEEVVTILDSVLTKSYVLPIVTTLDGASGVHKRMCESKEGILIKPHLYVRN